VKTESDYFFPNNYYTNTNVDLLTPLSLAPVPTPFMPFYNIGSPAPPPASTPSTSLNLTPPQTPREISYPTFQPFQIVGNSTSPPMPDLPTTPGFQNPYFSGPFISNSLVNPFSLELSNNHSPPLESFDRQARQFVSQASLSPKEDHVNPKSTPSPQILNINNQPIHIQPLSTSGEDSTSSTTYPTQNILPQAPLPISSLQMPLYPAQYPTYSPLPQLPFSSNHHLNITKPEPKPMSQALGFLFEKSLGSVRRWRENGLTIQVFYCAVCQLPTDSEDRMLKHIEAFHRDLALPTPSPGGLFQCSICPQICADEASLAKHNLQHLSSNSGQETCKGCSQNFVSPEDLANHERDCALYRPYKCEYCGRGFIIAARLKHHRNECSAGPVPPVFTCKVCNKRFNQFIEYCQHVPVHAFM